LVDGAAKIKGKLAVRDLMYSVIKTNTMGKKADTNKGKDKTIPALKPDKETLHKTDPQENMEGPISSVMQNIKESSEKDDDNTKEEADRKKDKNM